MDVNKLITYIENSFLSDLLMNESVTDISYNGESIYYLDNNLGRQKRDTQVEPQLVRDFVRQIANLSEKQFSYQEPELDVSFGRYRLTALHQTVCRKRNMECICFSIRIASKKLRIKEDEKYFPKEICDLLDVLIDSNVSIVIGGLTGSGKTELQKYLISRMKENTRTIVIDNILELDQLEIEHNLDLNIWQVDDNRANTSIQNLVKTALRSNPDWLIVAESRGKEMLDVLNSSLTGHPIITTCHAFDIKSMPYRMARMVMMNEQKMDFDDVYQDIAYHMRFYIYLERKYRRNGEPLRYVSSIAYLYGKEMEEIYGNDGNNKRYRPLPNPALNLLNVDNGSDLFKRVFIGGNK
ncbi:MAG: type II/IV secretion system ATPase subunit [Bacilli bacterium]|nr:type II/IV secretion system ATPase subunit [Bacilli bacterium]